MVAAIGAPTGFSAQLPGPSTGGMRAELARYEKALSECVNCASAKTPEGQQEIQRLSAEIARLKARIEDAAKGAGAEGRRASVDPAKANTKSDGLPARADLNSSPQTPRSSDDVTIGGRIDILA